MLYLVATPLGNLEDLSIRQARTLAEADFILCEDTRSAGFLLKKIPELFTFVVNPQQKLISYYREKEFEKLPQVLELLEKEKNIALISESGLPIFSDPGLLLVQTLIKRNIPFTVIPGATAATTALILSGLSPYPSLFIGFFPKKESIVIQLIQGLKEVKKVLPELSVAFYESPDRIATTLTLLEKHWPTLRVVIARELTKKFEEIVRGRPAELLQREYKGELSVIIQ